jgi:fermentation-respiration switch protein FrsA (DUF1100 family)
MLRQLEEWFLFPRHLLGSPRPAPHAVEGLEPIAIESSEGTVEAWFLPALGGARASGRGPVVIFAHGNGEFIDEWPDVLEPYRWMGVGVLLPEYRGYGRSAGTPSEAAIRDDFEAFYDKIVSRDDVDASKVVLHGRSLGGGAVCGLARSRPAAGLILECTFTSVADVARSWLIPSALISNRFDNLSVVRSFAHPILILHGRRDHVVPYSHAIALEQAARTARLVSFDSDHNDLERSMAGFWVEIQRYLQSIGVLPNVSSPSPMG